jgi:GTPase
MEIDINNHVETGNLKNDKNDDYLQTILINQKIRDILSIYVLIGVVGKIKQGKSTLVKEITGVNTNPTSLIKTRKIQVCRLTDSIKIIDFSDYERMISAKFCIK